MAASCGETLLHAGETAVHFGALGHFAALIDHERCGKGVGADGGFGIDHLLVECLELISDLAELAVKHGIRSEFFLIEGTGENAGIFDDQVQGAPDEGPSGFAEMHQALSLFWGEAFEEVQLGPQCLERPLNGRQVLGGQSDGDVIRDRLNVWLGGGVRGDVAVHDRLRRIMVFPWAVHRGSLKTKGERGSSLGGEFPSPSGGAHGRVPRNG